MDWNYITKRVQYYNAQPSDDLLYRLGTHVDVLTPEDCEFIGNQKGVFHPQQRYRVLNWLCCQDEIEINHDLTLLIFGKNQLIHWFAVSRHMYPNFEFYLSFEFQPMSETGWESGINYTCFWMPKPGAPMPDSDMDFPMTARWECGEQFWGNFPNGATNELEFTMSVYPNQESFTDSKWILEEGDWQCTPTDQEADLMSVDQVLQSFSVSV